MLGTSMRVASSSARAAAAACRTHVLFRPVINTPGASFACPAKMSTKGRGSKRTKVAEAGGSGEAPIAASSAAGRSAVGAAAFEGNYKPIAQVGGRDGSPVWNPSMHGHSHVAQDASAHSAVGGWRLACLLGASAAVAFSS